MRMGLRVNEAVKVDVDLVLVPLTVTDQQDRLIIGLQKDNFVLYDGADRQVIRNLSTEDAPISLGVIFDISSRCPRTILAFGSTQRGATTHLRSKQRSSPLRSWASGYGQCRPPVNTLFTWHLDGSVTVRPSARSALRTESLVAAAVEWARWIMQKTDDVFPNSGKG